MPDPYFQEYRITIDFHGTQAEADDLSDQIVNTVAASIYDNVNVKQADGSVICLNTAAFLRHLEDNTP